MPYTPTPIKYYKTVVNGRTHYEAQPWAGNIPYGYTEVSEQEYRQATRDTRQYTSPYTLEGGRLQNIAQLEEMQRIAIDPNMVNVGTAQRPLYMPRGSTGETTYRTMPTGAATMAWQETPIVRTASISAPSEQDVRQTLVASTTAAQRNDARTALRTQGIQNPTFEQLANYLNVNVGVTQSLAPVSTTVTPQTTFNTGNAELDRFMNETWLPLLEAEFSGDPTQILNAEAFNKIKERVEATYGPIFQQELTQAQEAYTRNQAELTAQRSATERKLGVGGEGETGMGTELTRALEDIGASRARTQEDLGLAQQRIARNYQEAMADSTAALQARNLLAGGTRVREERKLGEARELELASAQHTATRTLEDLQRQEARAESDIPFERRLAIGTLGRREGELTSEYAQQRRTIEGERTLQEAEERRRLRELGGSLLQNPQFIPNA